MKTANYQAIDIVIPWVDGSDPAWLEEKARYAGADAAANSTAGAPVDDAPARYRDGGTLKYLLRSIELYMPWVHTVHFVTWGHLPEWLNPDAAGLHVVRHEDYIPSQYLPTFSSHTIELNMHRIPELAEQFIYFNDDLLVTRPLKPADFFRHGLPVDFAVETALCGKYHHSVSGIQLSNSEIINQNFSKRKVFRENPLKWFHPRYGPAVFKTLALCPWPRFSDFSCNHIAHPFLKKTFEEVWEKEYDAMDETCRHRFRTMNDSNQWLMRDWQLVSGRFIPGRADTGKAFLLGTNLSELKKIFREKKYSVVCINDVSYHEPEDYVRTVEELKACLEEAYPTPSRFEKQ